MYDYMKALYRGFGTSSERMTAPEKAANKTHRLLANRLAKPERKMLLRLVDLEAALRGQACLNSFMSGYRLAQGIQQELLADQPPDNVEDEDERQACEIAREEGCDYGKETSQR